MAPVPAEDLAQRLDWDLAKMVAMVAGVVRHLPPHLAQLVVRHLARDLAQLVVRRLARELAQLAQEEFSTPPSRHCTSRCLQRLLNWT